MDRSRVRRALIYWQIIYVFNKSYLELDLDTVLRQLRLEPSLQPPVEGATYADATPCPRS